jgi:hypothetical protein
LPGQLVGPRGIVAKHTDLGEELRAQADLLVGGRELHGGAAQQTGASQ